MSQIDSGITLKEEILEILQYCINCRFCLPSCPRFEITSGEVCQGASGITRSLYYAVKWNETDKNTLHELKELLYGCTTCKSCEIACKSLSTGTKLVDAIEKGRELLIDKMIGPMPEQKKVLESLYKHGNPHMMTQRKRKATVQALNLPIFTQETEFLLYLGCTTAIDQDMQSTVLALSDLLNAAQVSYGILEDETCCGEPSLKLGEAGLFEEICEKNLSLFHESGVKNIVTLSPHCFETFSAEYPKEKMTDIHVQHYTQFLWKLIEQKKLVFSKNVDKRVAYHDPCYLSKYNNVCEEPRKVISSIPGIECVEFSRAGIDSLCCGGGGGRMWADLDSEVNRLANVRVKEAVEIGAEIMVSACPWCFTNMSDGIKQMNVESELEVLSVVELCSKAL